jgi:hypothetical protein
MAKNEYKKKHHKKAYPKQHRNKKKTTTRMATMMTKPLKMAVQKTITENKC